MKFDLFVCLFVCVFVCLFFFVCVFDCFLFSFVVFCFVLLYFSCLCFETRGRYPTCLLHWHQPLGIGPSGRRFAVHRSDISPRTSMVGAEVAPVSCVAPLIFDDIYH